MGWVGVGHHWIVAWDPVARKSSHKKDANQHLLTHFVHSLNVCVLCNMQILQGQKIFDKMTKFQKCHLLWGASERMWEWESTYEKMRLITRGSVIIIIIIIITRPWPAGSRWIVGMPQFFFFNFNFFLILIFISTFNLSLHHYIYISSLSL